MARYPRSVAERTYDERRVGKTATPDVTCATCFRRQGRDVGVCAICGSTKRLRMSIVRPVELLKLCVRSWGAHGLYIDVPYPQEATSYFSEDGPIIPVGYSPALRDIMEDRVVCMPTPLAILVGWWNHFRSRWYGASAIEHNARRAFRVGVERGRGEADEAQAAQYEKEINNWRRVAKGRLDRAEEAETRLAEIGSKTTNPTEPAKITIRSNGSGLGTEVRDSSGRLINCQGIRWVMGRPDGAANLDLLNVFCEAVESDHPEGQLPIYRDVPIGRVLSTVSDETLRDPRVPVPDETGLRGTPNNLSAYRDALRGLSPGPGSVQVRQMKADLADLAEYRRLCRMHHRVVSPAESVALKDDVHFYTSFRVFLPGMIGVHRGHVIYVREPR